MTTATATTTKPYFIRAVHEWCADNGLTPYLSVVVNARCRVPMEHVKEGQIVLNIGYNATRDLQLGNEFIHFHARFNGVSRDIVVDIGAVNAIFARETGEGMMFEPDDATVAAAGHEDMDCNSPPREPEPGPDKPAGGRPHLRVVK